MSSSSLTAVVIRGSGLDPIRSPARAPAAPPAPAKKSQNRKKGKMVASFRRTASLPGPDRVSPPEKSYHVRSTSLPCRSHPLISQLEDELSATRAWLSKGSPSPAWIRSGLIRLELLHLALDDLLRLPQIQDSLRRRASSGLTEELLDGFLRFADAYGSFRSALVSLNDLQSAAQVAVRRGDEARLASAARSLSKAEKEVAALASALRDSSPAPAAAASSEDSELAGVLRDVKAVTVSVSEAVFRGSAAALSSATAAVAPKSSSSWASLRRKLGVTSSSSSARSEEEGEERVRRATETLEGLEECVAGLEGGSERVFRGLINTRVSLLNILTP